MPRQPRKSQPSSPQPSPPPLVPIGQHLPLPHERDEATGPAATQATDDGSGGAAASGSSTAAVPDVIGQAKRDIDAGLVDTDMRATPGLDAERREALVPTPKPADAVNPLVQPDLRVQPVTPVRPRPQTKGPQPDRPPTAQRRP